MSFTIWVFLLLLPLLLLLLLLLQGYPGTLEASVRYELLSHSAELRITISATTDKPTPGAAFDWDRDVCGTIYARYQAAVP
jgi:hypothetical protein